MDLRLRVENPSAVVIWQGTETNKEKVPQEEQIRNWLVLLDSLTLSDTWLQNICFKTCEKTYMLFSFYRRPTRAKRNKLCLVNSKTSLQPKEIRWKKCKLVVLLTLCFLFPFPPLECNNRVVSAFVLTITDVYSQGGVSQHCVPQTLALPKKIRET